MADPDGSIAATRRTTHGDLTDEEWALISDLLPSWSGAGQVGRPTKWDKRDIVNAIFYVAATGCQWRALPKNYPHWNTVHRYHVAWSKDGTWEAICERLGAMVREAQGREAEPSAGVIDARSVRGAATVTAPTRGHDAGKRISGRKTFGVVDTTGLLLAVVVLAASTSDNTGGIGVIDVARAKSARAWPRCSATKDSRRPSSPTAGPTISRPRSSPASPLTPSRSSPDAGWSSAPGRG